MRRMNRLLYVEPERKENYLSGAMHSAKARVDHTRSTTHIDDREAKRAAGPQPCEMDPLGRALGE